MVRPYAELVSNDPAWPDLQKAAAKAPNGAVVLPPVSDEQRRACLEAVQVTTRSTLGAIAHETGGILVDRGFVRHLGSGSPKLSRRLIAWNEELGIDLARYIIVADDVVGGVYAMNGGELGKKLGRIFYFAPDALDWEDTELGHTDFVTWTLEGDLDKFYESMRWPGWEKEVAAVAGDAALSIVPPLWADGDVPIADRDRRAVPAKELWSLQQDFSDALAKKQKR